MRVVPLHQGVVYISSGWTINIMTASFFTSEGRGVSLYLWESWCLSQMLGRGGDESFSIRVSLFYGDIWSCM